jgi:SpoVK/Ycf46/Vps4 family AAA+-type ATPase
MAFDGPIGVVLERRGGVTGTALEPAITINLELPGPELRHEHWSACIGDSADLASISSRFRLSSGNIRRAAALAKTYTSLGGRRGVTTADVQEATRSLNRQALETIATPVQCRGSWKQMAAPDETLTELRALESRCRYREQLRDRSGIGTEAAVNCGVRALFSGPSGTGKTMAARLLAVSLQMDLYRVDLSSVVNKYIGETEKNLNQVFSRAEELDVILLLDEGDALLTNRTSVQTSNDRYANLETNFLLQRIESFEGILLVTTNAAGRIDPAFQRRMDVVVEFRAPEPAERWSIWQVHLPPDHAVDARWMEETAVRCAVTGGQIRNAVLHASMLALSRGDHVRTTDIEQGVRREYRKTGAVCPLRQR